MSPSDRKVVHDTVNDLEGLETGSEGWSRAATSSSVRPRAPSAQESSVISAEEDGDRSSESADLG